ncbi:MAG: transcription initiation protein [Alphaproteobacteria bacterium]|nr:transcription initiation protein [Alphaproteobacteria bacterium]
MGGDVDSVARRTLRGWRHTVAGPSTETDTAQYILLLHQNPNDNLTMPREAMMETIRRYSAWAGDLGRRGKLVSGEKLTTGAIRKFSVKDGKPVVADGAYAEAKDVISGYFVIEAANAAEADAIVRECPHLREGNWIELRALDQASVDEAKKGA